MRISIRTKLMLVFIVVFSIPIIMTSFVVSHFAQNFAEEKSLDLNIQNMNYIGSSVDLIFGYIYNYSLYPPFDNNIVSYLTADQDDEEYYGLRRTATNSIILLPYTNSNIQGVTIWRNDGAYIQSGKSMTLSQDEKDHLEQTKGYPLWDYQENGESTQIYALRLLKNPLDLKTNMGYIKIRLDNQSLDDTFNHRNDNSSIYFMMDETGKIFYQSQKWNKVEEEFSKETVSVVRSFSPETVREQVGSSCFYKKGDCYLTAHEIANTNWMVFSISKNSFSINLLKYLDRIFKTFLFICIPMCILLAMIFSALILSPLKKMGQLMKQIEKENFSVHLKVVGNDELAVMARQFNHMSDELADLYNRVYLGNIRLKEAQLEALQAQINPHFLYNTLDTIYWMSEFNHTEDVSKMISALSQLFRLSLSGDQNDMIPLSSELEHIKCFLYIEKIRYDDQLEYDIRIVDEDMAKNASDYMVLKLILQPITENAILHGIERCGKGNVNITISRDGECIKYEVSNTGSADVERINQILNGPAYQTGSIGLCNIQQRIHLKYGEQYGIICFNRDDCTVVQVRMPLRTF